MKHQALFSSEYKSRKMKMSSAAILLGSLRVIPIFFTFSEILYVRMMGSLSGEATLLLPFCLTFYWGPTLEAKNSLLEQCYFF